LRPLDRIRGDLYPVVGSVHVKERGGGPKGQGKTQIPFDRKQSLEKTRALSGGQHDGHKEGEGCSGTEKGRVIMGEGEVALPLPKRRATSASRRRGNGFFIFMEGSTNVGKKVPRGWRHGKKKASRPRWPDECHPVRLFRLERIGSDEPGCGGRLAELLTPKKKRSARGSRGTEWTPEKEIWRFGLLERAMFKPVPSKKAPVSQEKKRIPSLGAID